VLNQCLGKNAQGMKDALTQKNGIGKPVRGRDSGEADSIAGVQGKKTAGGDWDVSVQSFMKEK